MNPNFPYQYNCKPFHAQQYQQQGQREDMHEWNGQQRQTSQGVFDSRALGFQQAAVPSYAPQHSYQGPGAFDMRNPEHMRQAYQVQKYGDAILEPQQPAYQTSLPATRMPEPIHSSHHTHSNALLGMPTASSSRPSTDEGTVMYINPAPEKKAGALRRKYNSCADDFCSEPLHCPSPTGISTIALCTRCHYETCCCCGREVSPRSVHRSLQGKLFHRNCDQGGDMAGDESTSTKDKQHDVSPIRQATHGGSPVQIPQDLVPLQENFRFNPEARSFSDAHPAIKSRSIPSSKPALSNAVNHFPVFPTPQNQWQCSLANNDPLKYAASGSHPPPHVPLIQALPENKVRERFPVSNFGPQWQKESIYPAPATGFFYTPQNPAIAQNNFNTAHGIQPERSLVDRQISGNHISTGMQGNVPFLHSVSPAHAGGVASDSGIDNHSDARVPWRMVSALSSSIPINDANGSVREHNPTLKSLTGVCNSAETRSKSHEAVRKETMRNLCSRLEEGIDFKYSIGDRHSKNEQSSQKEADEQLSNYMSRAPVTIKPFTSAVPNRVFNQDGLNSEEAILQPEPMTAVSTVSTASTSSQRDHRRVGVLRIVPNTQLEHPPSKSPENEDSQRRTVEGISDEGKRKPTLNPSRPLHSSTSLDSTHAPQTVSSVNDVSPNKNADLVAPTPVKYSPEAIRTHMRSQKKKSSSPRKLPSARAPAPRKKRKTPTVTVQPTSENFTINQQQELPVRQPSRQNLSLTAALAQLCGDDPEHLPLIQYLIRRYPELPTTETGARRVLDDDEIRAIIRDYRSYRAELQRR